MGLDELKAIEEYPDISFIDFYTLSQLNSDMMQWFREKKKELTGQDAALPAGDDRRIILQTCAYYLYQAFMHVDDGGKMGLLKYSRGDYLELLGMFKKTPRNPARGATTTLRFSIPEARSFVTGIPQGTRATAGNNLYFSTSEYAEIPAGSTYVDVPAECTQTGTVGNYLDVGEINILVDSVPFISGVSNITMPENGQDVELDNPYRLRIYLAPAGYSNAGSEDGYKYFVLSFNSNITDILISSPEECEVHIWYLLENGRVPGEESLNALKDYLEEPSRKPITDHVVIHAPEQVQYNIKLTYYINKSDSNRATSIQEGVNAAVAEYNAWQTTKIGRDINPDELISRLKTVGVKRVAMASPTFTVISGTKVPKVGTVEVDYGGLEDD